MADFPLNYSPSTSFGPGDNPAGVNTTQIAGTTGGMPSASTSPQDSQFDLDLIKSNPNTKVIMTPNNQESGKNFVLSGVLASEPNFGGGNSFSSQFDRAFSGFFGTANSMTSILSKKGVFERDIPNVAFTNVLQTLASWSGSERFTIGLELEITASASDQNVLVEVAKALNFVYPIKGDPNRSYSDSTGWLVAPLGYNAKSKGLITLQIGQWFAAHDAFVVNRIGSTMTRQTHSNNTPLSTRISIDLQTYRLYTIDEILGWFKPSLSSLAPTANFNPLNIPGLTSTPSQTQDLQNRAQTFLNSLTPDQRTSLGIDPGITDFNQLPLAQQGGLSSLLRSQQQ